MISQRYFDWIIESQQHPPATKPKCTHPTHNGVRVNKKLGRKSILPYWFISW